MLRVRMVAMLVLALFASAAAAEAVFRCEGKDGRVTYSDAVCPSDSRATRKLEEAPPVSISPSKTAPRAAREAGQIAQSHGAGRQDATQENRQLDEQIAATQQECAQLERRVQYARQDLEGATPTLRSTAELALRRAQDQYSLYCRR